MSVKKIFRNKFGSNNPRKEKTDTQSGVDRVGTELSLQALRELQKIKSPKRSFVVTAQRSSPVNVGAYCIRPGAQAFTPTHTFLSVQRVEDLYFAIP